MIDPIQKIDDATSFSLRMQNALGFSIPPIIPFKETVTVQNQQDIDASTKLQSILKSGLKSISSVNYITPITLIDDKITGKQYIFPIDPTLSLSGKNIIVRRNVAKKKGRGTIKENWSQDDFDITISGVLIADDTETLYTQQQQLTAICQNGKRGLSVVCDVLNNYMGICRLAIVDYDLPFTKGECNQSFTIKALSDDDYTLFVKNNV